MTRLRIPALAFGLLTLCLAAAAARGQSGTIDLTPFKMAGKPLDGTGLTQLQQMSKGEVKTRGPQEKSNKALLKQAAEFYVFRVTQDQYYTGGDTGELKVRTGGDQNLDVAFEDLNLHLLVPKPGQRVLIDQMNYIEDFGAALDQAVVAVLTSKGVPPPVIRINAARMLAMAARTGAPAHAKTITALLTNQFFKADGKPAETPPDVLYWALKAAENLLAAPDPSALGTPNAARHTIKDEDLVPLVRALNDMVLNNPKGLAEKSATLAPELAVKPPPAPGAPSAPATPGTPAPAPASTLQTNPNALTAEQADLIRYFRRQAIRALGAVRFDTVAEGTPNQIRPVFTLAKVAVSDVSLNPPPNAAEVGEATIGLTNVHPSSNLNVDALLHVIAYGTGRFFTPKAENPEKDKSLPWKAYAARVDDAYALLQKNAQTNPRLSPFRKQIGELSGIVTADTTAPLTATNGTGRPGFERLSQWVQSNQPKTGLYGDDKQYQLNPRAGR